MDKELTKDIRSLAMAEGIDLVGVAPVERFQQAPEGYKPTDYMPEATSVLSLAIHIADGVCDTWGEFDQPGKSISPYLFYGYGLLNMELARIANKLARRLEAKGYKSLTFPPTWSMSIYRWRGLHDGRLKADFSHKHAAVAAGLGEFGLSNLVLTPEFGPRVRLNSVITSAPLEPTPLYQGPALCQPKECHKLCIRECPARALDGKKTDKLSIGDRQFEYASLDFTLCHYGILGLVKGSGSIRGVEIPPGPGNMRHVVDSADNQYYHDKTMRENCFGLICGDFCGRCLHQCPANTFSPKGKKGKVSSK